MSEEKIRSIVRSEIRKVFQPLFDFAIEDTKERIKIASIEMKLFTCSKCKEKLHAPFPKGYEKGTMMIKCPKCGTVNPVKYF